MSEVDSKPFNHPILITGGAGFLGSHMVALCLEKQVDVVVIDNLSNSIRDVNFKKNDRIRYYFDNDVGGLVFKQKIEKSEYTVMRFPKNGKIKSDKVIKSFPEKNPKFILLKNVR